MAVHGTAGVLELKGRSGWRQSGGAFQERVWEVPTGRLAFFQTQQLPTGYTDISYEQDEDLTIVRAVYSAATAEQIGNPADDGLVDRRWELDGEDLEKSVWQQPGVMTATAGQTIQQAITLRNDVEKVLAGEQSWTNTGFTDVDSMVVRLARGIEGFLTSSFVLRKIEVVRRNASIRPAFTNLNRVFTYTGLLAAEPTLGSENLLQSSGLTTLKWLKRAPRVNPTQSGLWEITQEYQGAEAFDSWLYPVVV